jgi:hypothetical protein
MTPADRVKTAAMGVTIASSPDFERIVRAAFAGGLDTYDIGKWLEVYEADVLRVLRPYERLKSRDERKASANKEAWRRTKAINAKLRIATREKIPPATAGIKRKLR